MSFINPFLLIGIISAGIPLLIHLWSKRQAKLVDFSSIKFLMSLHRKRVKRLKLKQILILILRILIIVLIVLALARPVFTSRWVATAGGRAKKSVVIVLDNSYSMSYAGLEGSRFEIARDRSLRILDSLHPGDDASLILMSDFPDVVFKRLTSDIQQVKDTIENAQISHRGSHVLPSILEAYTLLKGSKNPQKKIYLISDLGENGWQDWKSIPPDVGIERVDTLVIRIGEKEVENRAVGNITMSNEFVGTGMPVQITAKVNDPILAQVSAELIVDGEKKGQTATNGKAVTFAHVFQHPGTHIGEIRLSPDRLSLDDVRYFAVDVLGQIKVLSAGEYKYYVNLALNPVEASSPETQSLIVPVNCSIEELGSLSLEQYSIVVLVDIPRLSANALQNLKNFYINGGNLVVFLGRSADRDWYNSRFDIIPATLGNRNSFLQNPLRVSGWNSNHPIFKLFRDGGTANILKSPETYSAFSIVPRQQADIIASFDRNIPAILETKNGKGKIILFNSSPDPEVSDLPLKPVFLPLMQQTMLYLVSEARKDSKNILVGDLYLQSIDEKIDSSLEIFSPENNSTKPAFSASEQSGNRIQYDATNHAGIYRLEFKSEGSIKRDYFAVNLDTAGESELKPARDEDVINKLGPQTRFLSPNDSLEEIIESSRSGSEISSRLLILAAILMLIEIPLANRYRVREEK